jgi:hypothetical protein
VRNPESGWRWGGNPAQRSAHLIPPKGIEPREGVFDACCERPGFCLRAESGRRPLVAEFVAPTTRCGHDRFSRAPGRLLPPPGVTDAGLPPVRRSRQRSVVIGPDRLRSLERLPYGHAACRGSTICDDRTVAAEHGDACFALDSESHPTGSVMRRLAFFGEPGRRLAEGRRDRSCTCVCVRDKPDTAGSLAASVAGAALRSRHPRAAQGR